MGHACQTCGCKIPWMVVIEGIPRDLCRRKYCLTCNPFRSRHPVKRKLLSTAEQEQRDSKRKTARVLAVTNRRRKLKQMAVEFLGGECIICGYNKCIGGLTFHHQDGSSKSFGISSKGISRGWEVIKRELRKCVLLCTNCHAEVHAGITTLPSTQVGKGPDC